MLFREIIHPFRLNWDLYLIHKFGIPYPLTSSFIVTVQAVRVYMVVYFLMNFIPV